MTSEATDKDPGGPASQGPLNPFTLSVEPVARFLNCELTDDPAYGGIELQWFDDAVHGRGMLAFLSRRADGLVDYYLEPSLALDPASFAIGAGTGAWTEIDFERAELEMAPDGVRADVAFTDVAGRAIEVLVDDRDGRQRRRAELLAPVGAAIERPNALLLVLLHDFDLVRATSPEPPVVRIDGRDASTGALPGERLHRRRLIKYAAPLTVTRLNHVSRGAVPRVDADDPGPAELSADGRGIAALEARQGALHARMSLTPPLPDLAELPPHAARHGSWVIDVDATRITGGPWSLLARGDQIDLHFDVDGRWRPHGLPLLMRLVTSVVPTFRRWPTTYRWRAVVDLHDEPTLTARWERTGAERGQAYRRATAGR